MNLKEHLQFLAMMIPTLLLLAALVASFAFPAQSAGADSVQVAFSVVAVEAELQIGDDNDVWPSSSAAAR